MKEASKRVLDILESMSVEEKALQLSCVIPMLLMEGETISEDKMRAVIPGGIGRMTQYATGFLSGPRSAAEGHNAIQKYALENTKSKVPVIIQNESAAGLVAAGATVFPVPIAVASTWEPELARQMGGVISKQARAIGVKVAMSPVADVARDSRWGRVGETFGEDPLLAARFSSMKVQGIQGESYRDNVMSCAKHFLAYGMSETGVNTAVINMGNKDLVEVYGTPFAAAIKEADMQYVMVTYSEIDGLPMSVNEEYMNGVLREDMGFNGIAICDGGSIPRCQQTQGMFTSVEELAGKALRAGIDADTPYTSVYNHIKEGVEQGLVSEEDLDRAVLKNLIHKEEMGLLDDPFVDPDKAEAAFAASGGEAVSAEIAAKELVLLQNNGVLPLAEDLRKIALIGPFADRLSTFFGGYAYPSFIEMIACICLGEHTSMEAISEFFEKMMDFDDVSRRLGLDRSKPYEENIDGFLRRSYGICTLREALDDKTGAEVVCARGSAGPDEAEAELEKALAAARDSDVVVLTLGEVTGFGRDATSGEGVNNPDLSLPGNQKQLLDEVAKLGKPIVLVLFNGRPLALGDVAGKCDAILEAWYPGPHGAGVVAGALTGELSPGGKLPITFPQISAQCPVYYGHKAGSGYTKIDGTPDMGVLQPLFPFGHGLSYTSFQLQGFACDEQVPIGESFGVSVQVENTGDTEGDEVLQVYTRTQHPSVVRPVKELRAFKRVHLAPGEKKTLHFVIHTHALGYYNFEKRFVVEPGGLEVMVGTSSSDIAFKHELQLTGEVKEILHEREFGFGATAE